MDFVNAAIVSAFNLAVLGLLAWFVGSVALRFVGWGWMLFGLAIAVNGAPTGQRPHDLRHEDGRPAGRAGGRNATTRPPGCSASTLAATG